MSKRTPQHLDPNLRRCDQDWEEVKRLVTEICAEEVLPPSPSRQNCRFCPFNGNGCDAALPEENAGELW